MKYTFGFFYCLVSGLVFAASPDGPSQQCMDDAGPIWADDIEYFGNNAYSHGTPAAPKLLDDGSCPSPLQKACDEKGPQRAFLEGPAQCGGKGWFCRIMEQTGWSNPDYSDRNFAHCNATDADERDNDGHCHGSDTDNVFGWWVRDHWFRGYAGTLHCCCDWETTKGLVNRCDYRKYVAESELDTCRDANEEHENGYEGTCEAYSNIQFKDPIMAESEMCWTIYNFADPESVPNPNPIVLAPSPSNPNSDPTTQPPENPTPQSPTQQPDSNQDDEVDPEEEDEDDPIFTSSSIMNCGPLHAIFFLIFIYLQ